MNIVAAIGSADHGANPYSPIIDQHDAAIHLALTEALADSVMTPNQLAAAMAMGKIIRERILLALDIEDLIAGEENHDSGVSKLKRVMETAAIPNRVKFVVFSLCRLFIEKVQRVYAGGLSEQSVLPQETDTEGAPTPMFSYVKLVDEEGDSTLESAMDLQERICREFLEAVIKEIGINDPSEIQSFKKDLRPDQQLALKYQPFLNHAYAFKIACEGDVAGIRPADVLAYMDNPSIRFAYTSALRALFPNADRDEVDLFYHHRALYKFDVGKPWVMLVEPLKINGRPAHEVFEL